MELGVNIAGAEIISKMLFILCFDVLIFGVKNGLCFVNYSKKIYILYYVSLI